MKDFKLKGIPIFRILDYKKAIQFYVDLLGFNIDWNIDSVWRNQYTCWYLKTG